MRIAWISYSFGEYCVQQARALAEVHPTLLALASDELAPYRADTGRAEVYELGAPRLRQPVRQAVAIQRLLKRIDDFRPDVIHFQHGHLWFNLLGLPRLRRYPLVVTIHDPRQHAGDRSSQKTPQGVMDRGYRAADRVIVHGEWLKQAVTAHLGIPAERIDVTPHVALDAREPKTTVAEDPNCVLFFGRIWQYKGLRYLLEAAPRVAERVPNAHFVIAGEGDDLAPYRALAKPEHRFTFLNRWIADEERAELFARAAVVVLPYVEATQSGVTPLAYAHGKPVVASQVGALAESVIHNRTGLLVPPREPAQLADAIAELLLDSARRRELGAAGRRLVETEWSPAAVAQKNLNCYELAIAQRRPVESRRPLTGPLTWSTKAS